VILMTGMELGLGPMQALQNIAVVNGKPTSEAKLILALIQSRCPDALIQIESTHDKAVVKMTRGQNSYTTVWDVTRAQKLGLMEKPNYRSQLGTMLKWRAVTDAARTVFPDIVMGLYSDDEAQDIRARKEVESTVVDGVSRGAERGMEPVAEVIPEPEAKKSRPELIAAIMSTAKQINCSQAELGSWAADLFKKPTNQLSDDELEQFLEVLSKELMPEAVHE
jgi:hypothetical protein